MNTQTLANRIRALYAGQNWTDTNLKEKLEQTTLKQAVTEHEHVNSILAITFHFNYYVEGISEVLKGGALDIRDQFSYQYPTLETEEEWQHFVQQCLQNGEQFAQLVEQLSIEQLQADFTNPKYGSYYKNIIGCIEHIYYHFGQIVLLQKMIH